MGLIFRLQPLRTIARLGSLQTQLILLPALTAGHDFFPIVHSNPFSLGGLYSTSTDQPRSVPPYQASYTLNDQESPSYSTIMSPSVVDQPFVIPELHDLRIGRQLTSSPATGYDGPTMTKGQWSLPPGDYTPRQIVEAFAPLIETVIHVLGSDQPGQPTAREMLFDNLASNLAIDTRESSLQIPAKDAGRKEMAGQAIKIGKTLVNYARQVKGVTYDPKYAIRSPCEGHLLKPHVAHLMFGPRSLGHLMQVYNEYLHQMVLLRDSLLPFENYGDVVIPIVHRSGKGGLGMRFTETQRMSFIAELMTKSITQASVFKLAQALLAPSLSFDKAYGFQYKSGLVLPGAVVGSKSLRLLRYIPAEVSSKDTAFEYSLTDYYTAAKTEIPAPEKTIEAGAQILSSISSRDTLQSANFELADGPSKSGSSRLQLHLQHDNGLCSSVDVGQIARGWRYAYHVRRSKETSVGQQSFTSPAAVHSAANVLSKTGQESLATAKEGGIHLIEAESKIEVLALLGRLYPDNIILLEDGGSFHEVEKAGQSLPGEPRFVIHLAGEED